MIRSGELAMEEMPFDSKRRLCPDGACVGILGADGRCSVCQRPAGASAAWASDVAPDGDERDDGNGGDDEDDEDDEDDGATAASSASPSSSSFASPNLASPSLASPNLASPSLASPSLASPSIASPKASSGFDSKRRLCDDGSCVGIVGPDGVCGTCGRKAE
jgi:hypothetical protein